MVGMAQKFKNSLPLLEGVGQFGSLRSPAAGAPRYISAKLHPNFRLLYQDFDLLENKIEEGEKIEPAFFLPIVPTVILNGTSGIAVGFATNILNRNPKDVVDACISTLNNKKMKVLAPWIQEFKGTFIRDLENPKTWKIKGQYQIINTTTVKITAIPPNYTYERYEEILNLLQEKGIITSYDDNSSETIEYILKFRRSVLNSLVSSEGKLERTLRLNTQETENLTTLDENGKLKIFDKAEDIVKHFVDVRLGWYQTRKDYLIDKTEKQLSLVTNKARFIKDIIDGKLKINNVPKEKIVTYLKTNAYDTVHGSYDYLLSMAIHSLTKERYEKLLLEKEGCIIALKTLKATDPKEMYLTDLKKLKQSIK